MVRRNSIDQEWNRLCQVVLMEVYNTLQLEQLLASQASLPKLFSVSAFAKTLSRPLSLLLVAPSRSYTLHKKQDQHQYHTPERKPQPFTKYVCAGHKHPE